MTDRTRRLAGNPICLTPLLTQRLLGAVSLSALMLGVATPLASPAKAQTPATASETETSAARSFAIAPQALDTALDAFSEATGISFAYASGELAGLRSPGASGPMTPRDALAQLLAGTGVSYRFSGARTVTLTRGGTNVRNDGPIEAGPLMIEGGATGGRRSAAEDAPFETPGSTAYISREQIDRVQPSSPGDIFREVPSVLSGASNDGTSINVNIRSAQGLNRVRTMVEGTQQESSGYQGYAGADQRTYIDPELIGGVEIAKGPGGGPYSTGTTAGLVNIRLLDADDLIKHGGDFGFRVRGGLGGNAVAPRFLAPEDSFNTDRNANTGLLRNNNDILTEDNWFYSLAGGYKTDRFDMVVAYTSRKEGNYFAGKNGPETFTFLRDTGTGPEPTELRFSPIDAGEEVPNTSEDTESILVKGTLRFNDGQSLEAGFTRYDSDFGQVFPSSLNLWAPQQFDLNEVESKRYWLRYKWESENDLINLQTNLWSTNAEETGELRQGPQKNDAWGAEIWNASFIETGLGGLTLTYGAEYSRSEAVIDLFAPLSGTQFTLGEGPREVEGEIAPPFDGAREVFGGYLNAVLAPTDWLTLNAGLRYDRFKGESATIGSVDTVDDSALRQLAADYAAAEETFYELEELFFDGLISEEEYLAAEEAFFELEDMLFSQPQLFLQGFRGQVLEENESSGERFSPRVGVTVEPADGLQLFAQYSEGFRALSLVELGQTYNAPVIVNPELEPEVVKTWEVGVNYLKDGLFFEDDALRAKLVYFNNDYDNFVARTGVQGSRFFFENVPDVTVSGFEASIAYDAKNIFVDLNFSAFDQPFDIPTQASIDQPEYAGTLTVGTRWFDEDLELGARLNAFGEPNEGSGSTFFGDEFFHWSSQEIVDLFGSYKFNDTVAVGFSVENLTDQYYVPPLFVSRIPAPGRTVRVNLTAHF